MKKKKKPFENLRDHRLQKKNVDDAKLTFSSIFRKHPSLSINIKQGFGVTIKRIDFFFYFLLSCMVYLDGYLYQQVNLFISKVKLS